MRFKKPTFHAIPALIGFAVAALIAWGLSHWTSLPFWGAFAIVVGAMFINGVIADHEDNEPGGFNNPLPSEEAQQVPIQPVQHNAGSRPSSGDSPTSASPSLLGPRG